MSFILNNSDLHILNNKYNISELRIEPIYHYTSSQGFNGIITSKTLRATHSSNLNDWSEMLISYEIILFLLENEFSSLSKLKNEIASDIINSLRNKIENREYPNIFVASFSLNPDDILLWKSYGNFNDSYALEFHKIFIESYALENGAELLKCIYEGKKQKEFYQDLIEYFFNKIDNSIDKELYLQEFFKLINLYIPIIKNEKFSQENEIRLIYRHSSDQLVADIKTGINKSSFYKYMEIPITRSEPNTEFEHAIESIMIGPNSRNNSEKKQFKNRLDSFLNEHIKNMYHITETEFCTLKF